MITKTFRTLCTSFRNFQKIYLEIRDSRLSTKLNQQMLTQLLHYLSQIDHFIASGLTANHEVMTYCIGTFWKATSGPGERGVELSYTDNQSTKEVLSISKMTGLCGNKTEIAYPSPNLEYKHMDFIKKNGKFISNLTLAFSTEYTHYTERGVIPECTFLHTLTHCKYMEYLTFEQWTFKRPTAISPKLDTVRHTSLIALEFEQCTIEQGVLQKMSLFLRELHRLRLNRIRSADGEVTENDSGGTKILHVDMPDTSICIVELEYSFPDDDPVYVQLYVNDKLCHYYRYDSFEVGYCKKSIKQEYMEVGNHRYI